MPHSAASDLGLQCLPITLLRVYRLQWVNKSRQKHRMPNKKRFITHADNDGLDQATLLHSLIRALVTCLQLIVLGFNDTSTLEGHFVSSPREREKRDRRDSRGDERGGQGRKRNRNESEETEEIKTFPLYPYLLQG